METKNLIVTRTVTGKEKSLGFLFCFVLFCLRLQCFLASGVFSTSHVRRLLGTWKSYICGMAGTQVGVYTEVNQLSLTAPVKH
jgi:hypothetical protein